jgi:hypothetical protein
MSAVRTARTVGQCSLKLRKLINVDAAVLESVLVAGGAGTGNRTESSGCRLLTQAVLR